MISFVGNRGTFTRGYKAMVLDFEFLYHLIYLIICCLGVFVHVFFYSLLVRGAHTPCAYTHTYNAYINTYSSLLRKSEDLSKYEGSRCEICPLCLNAASAFYHDVFKDISCLLARFCFIWCSESVCSCCSCRGVKCFVAVPQVCFITCLSEICQYLEMFSIHTGLNHPSAQAAQHISIFLSLDNTMLKTYVIHDREN